MRKILVTLLFLFVSAGVVLAGGKKEEPPEVILNMESKTVISPSSSLGTQDSIDFIYSIAPAQGKTITLAQLAVLDSEGSVVWEYEKIPPKEKGEPFSEKITWDGSHISGRKLADGNYLLQAITWDSNSIYGESDIKQITIDNTVPEVSISIPYNVFSPNGDGRKDFLVIEQDGSSEKLWKAEIKNAAGTTVVTKQWVSNRPVNFTWNGKDSSGKLVPDGNYSYTIVSTDNAGNSVEKTVSGIVMNTKTAEIGFTRKPRSFSPNGDGILDTISFIPEIGMSEGLKSWNMEVRSQSGRTVWNKTGTEKPTALTYNGNNSEGNSVDDGEYTAYLSVLYNNGDKPEAVTDPFILDTQKPAADIAANFEIFSPDGDGEKDTLAINIEASEENRWTGSIVNGTSTPVKEFTWRGTPPDTLQWNGRNEEGAVVPNGEYKFVLTSTDAAGNKATYETDIFEKKNIDISNISILKNAEYLSPNGDGNMETIEFTLKIKNSDSLNAYTFEIIDEKGNPVFTEEGPSLQSSSFVWKGTDGNGSQLPDGKYTATLTAEYASGDTPSLSTDPFYIDTQAPSITIHTENTLFSPNGDDRKEAVLIQQDSSSEKLWEGKITDGSGNLVQETFWKGKADDFSWNGKNLDGEYVDDGVYSYTISSTDKAGNSTEKTVNDIRINTAATPIYVSAEKSSFSPNGDDSKDSIFFNVYAEVQEGIENWELVVLSDEDGSIMKRFTGDGSTPLPENIEWKGTDNQQKTAPEGSYKARFSITYAKGNKPQETTESSILLDVTDPTVSVSISPKPFSPDNDGNNDTVKIDVSAKDNNELTSWTGQILDPADHVFYELSGDGAVNRTFTWDGKSKDGELVQAASDYILKIKVSDPAGNMVEKTQIIPVDVFLIHEGDKTKIKISSIIFPPNSSDFSAVDKDQYRKNRQIIDRIAEILKKYKEYQIRMEGYAVKEYWRYPNAVWEQENVLLPLSKNRAESVKEALVDRGVNESRLSVKGFGGNDPIVPNSDFENRWKNRRVEFILTEQ